MTSFRPGSGCLPGAHLLCRYTCVAAMIAAAWPSLCAPASAETLRQALTSAYQTNPRLDAERARLRATDEEVSRVESGFRPTVIATADAGRSDTTSKPRSATAGVTNPWGYSLTLRQSVFSGFQTTNGVSEAEAAVKAGREDLRQIEQTVLLEAAENYVNVVRDMAIIKFREAEIEILSQDLQAAEARLAAKEVTRTDVAQARSRVARSTSQLDSAKSQLKTSRANYERVVGHPPNSVSAPPLRIKQLPKSLDEALREAERQNPVLGSALFQEEAARHAVDRIRGELLPDISLEASYAHREDPNVAFTEQEAASVTGRFSVPLYDGGEIRARVRQAKETHVSRLQIIEQARTETQAQVTSAWSRLVAARAQLKSDSIQVESTRVAADGVREEQKAGQRTVIEVLNAESEFIGAQIQLATTRREVIAASFQVLASMGILNADVLELGSEIYDAVSHLEDTRQNWFGIDVTHADGRREVYDAVDTAQDEADIVE